MTNGNDLAYPTFDDKGICPDSYSGGLTKREYFAAMAMNGCCSSDVATTTTSIAEWSVKMADALIEALNKTK